MIETDARVVAIEGGTAWVEAGRRSSCGHCDAAGSCGGSLFAELFGNRTVRVQVQNAINAVVGQQVVVGLPEGAMVSGAVRLYLFPLLGLFAGAVLGKYLFTFFSIESGEPGAILGGLLGLLAVPLLMRRLGMARDGQQPVILRKMAKEAVVGFQGLSQNEERE